MCVWNHRCLGERVCEGQSDVHLKYNFSGALYLVVLRQGLPPRPLYSTLPPTPRSAITSMCQQHIWLFQWELEELNSGSHACTANPLPTELYLRPNKSYKC